jgi:hypothetical protein
MLRLFTEHPTSVGETYGEHFRFASRTGVTLIVAGCACVIHGLLPFLFVTTGSRTIRNLAARLGGALPRRATQGPLRPTGGAGWSASDMDLPAVIESLTSAAL